MLILYIILGIILFILAIRIGLVGLFLDIVEVLLTGESSSGGGFGGGDSGGGGSSDDF